MTWIKLKDDLPKHDKDYVLFVRWVQLDQTNTKYPPLMIVSYAGTWREIQIHRKYELENLFTHWRKLGRAPKE